MENEVTRPRIGVGLEPFMARSAIHAALSRDDRVESVLFPPTPDVRLQAQTAEVDVVLVSHQTIRADALVVVLSPAGVVDVLSKGQWRSYPYEGLEALVDLTLSLLARRRHPSAIRPIRLVPAIASS